jgi:L-iditol 2-dehydrogenase
MTTSTSAQRVSAVVVDRTDGGITASYTTVERPRLDPTQVLVAPAYVGICGSDLEQMKGAMPDTFRINYPHVLGHEWSGEIVEVGSGVTSLKVDDLVIGHGELGGNQWFGVTEDGAMADVFAVAQDVCFRLKPGTNLISAALIEPFSCVLAALNKAGALNASHRVHVYGLGSIGLCAVVQASLQGAEVIAIDPSPKRRELALVLGASDTIDPTSTERAGEFDGTADVVVEASGAPAAQAAALESAAPGGRILMMGVSTQRPTNARLGLVQERDLTLISSTGAPVAVWDQAIRYVERHDLDLSPIVSTMLPFSRIEEALARAGDPGLETKVLLHPDTPR